MNAQDALRIVGFSGIGFTMEQFNEANSVLRSSIAELTSIKQRGEEWQTRFTEFNENLSKQRQTKFIKKTQYENRVIIKTIDYILKGENK